MILVGRIWLFPRMMPFCMATDFGVSCISDTETVVVLVWGYHFRLEDIIFDLRLCFLI